MEYDVKKFAFRKDVEIPVLKKRNVMAVNDREKAR